MKVLLIAILVVACLAEEFAVSKAYTDYLKKHVSWEVEDYETNVFRGWTVEESTLLLGDMPSDLADVIDNTIVVKKPQNMPESLDWRGNECIHSIGLQGFCGSCWAFTVAGVVSDRCCLAGKDHGWLSPQELVSCDTAVNEGCDGGDRTLAMQYVQAHGLVPEECFPYQYYDHKYPCKGKCENKQPWADAHVCKCKNVIPCTGAEGILACLANGPVAAGIVVYADFFYYKKGIYRWDKKSAFRGYHAIRLVGYTPEYWTCANSWGDDWGEKGYFRIGKGECKIEEREPVTCDPTP